MTWTDDLFLYVEAADPTFRSRTEGASARDIECVQTLLGTEIPQVYREFLLTMGRRDGGIWLGERFQSDVPTIVEMIATIKKENPTVDFSHFTPIALGDAIEGIALLETSTQNFQVVEIDHNKPGPYWAASLPAYLFGKAFVMHTKKLPHHAQTAWKEPKRIWVDLEKKVGDLGFSKEWFSDVGAYYGTKAGALLCFRASETKVDLWIHGQTRESVTDWLRALVESF